MKNFLSLLIIVVLITSSLSKANPINLGDKKFGYIGAEKCGMCHKKDADGNQLKVWQESKHAKAYEVLKSEAATKLAGGDATKTEACLKCHATGAGADASLNDAKFNIEKGVQCEACHGAGSEYKSMKIMKDRKAAVENGLVVWADEKAIEATCLTCHDTKNKPEGHPVGEFKFADYYAKIAHKKPVK